MEHRVDEAYVLFSSSLESLHALKGLIHRGMRGNAVEVDQLVGAQPQRPAHRRNLAIHRQLDVELQEPVERVLVTKRPIGDLLQKMPVTALEAADALRQQLIDKPPAALGFTQQLQRRFSHRGVFLSRKLRPGLFVHGPFSKVSSKRSPGSTGLPRI